MAQCCLVYFYSMCTFKTPLSVVKLRGSSGLCNLIVVIYMIFHQMRFGCCLVFLRSLWLFLQKKRCGPSLQNTRVSYCSAWYVGLSDTSYGRGFALHSCDPPGKRLIRVSIKCQHLKLICSAGVHSVQCVVEGAEKNLRKGKNVANSKFH